MSIDPQETSPSGKLPEQEATQQPANSEATEVTSAPPTGEMPPAPEGLHPAAVPESVPAESPVAESPAAESRMDDIPVPPEPSESSPAAEPAAAPPAPLPETTAPEQSGVGLTDQPAAEPVSDASSAQRIREKMAAATPPDEAAAAPGTELPHQRKEIPRGPRTVDIPAADDLDESLEAEIRVAMGAAESTPQPVLAADASEAGADAEQGQTHEVAPGTKVQATIVQIHEDNVFLDAGLRHNIVVSLKQFPEDKPPSVGESAGVVVEEIEADGLIRGRLPRGRHRAGGNWDALAQGQVVDCIVSATNKGGLQVTVSNLRAFLPASQIEIGYAGDLEKYVGQKLTVQVTEVNKKKRNLVVSRRALLEAERAEGEQQFWESVEIGQTFSGTVKTIKDYGAFINIGPVDGFLHIGEISWSRINHPSDVVQEGQQLDVKVLKLDPEKKRISLGLKQLAANPWAHAADKYASGRTVSGVVTRIADFGAFVELEPGLEGLVHISQLAWKRVGNVGEILTVGETREFQVQEIDLKRKRVSLSLKALEKRPESAPPETPEPDEPQTSDRSRNLNLKGGRGGTEKGGGLFGNPADFS